MSSTATAPSPDIDESPGGHGGIYGPYRRRLYHWTTKRLDAVAAVCEQLWTCLGDEKRAAISHALRAYAAERSVTRVAAPAAAI